MRIAALALALIAGSFTEASAQQLPPFGGPYPPPFTETLSNNTPLAFGMDADEAARALGAPLNYVSGRLGEEVYLTFRNIGGSGLFYKKDRLYLQFRKGRLAGWKRRLGPQLDVAVAAPRFSTQPTSCNPNKKG